MSRPAVRIPLFVLLVVGLFVGAGEVLSRASGPTVRVSALEEVSAEVGEQIFWSYGKCHTCHAVGPRGRSVRGPDLGQGPSGAPMGARAVDRARVRRGRLEGPFSATDYLVESLIRPSAHVVEGFKDEMPRIHEPPIALGPDELTSVIAYLQSLGGEADPSRIILPPEARRSRTREQRIAEWKPYLEGDSLRGRRLFFDEEGPAACGTCHRVGERGGGVGPELTHVAGIRTQRFILRSILEPDREIASGYETVLVQTTDGRLLDGVVTRETDDSLWLGDPSGRETGIDRSQVRRRRSQDVSLMPGNLEELLTVGDLHDLLAYLRRLR